MNKNFKFIVFMVGKYTAEGVKKGSVKYITYHYSRIPELFLEENILVDVALISVSPPDDNGNCSFGVSSDFTKAMAQSAKTVIADYAIVLSTQPSTGLRNIRESARLL